MNTMILVVEDDVETCEMLKAALEDAGYSVVCSGTVRGAKEFLSRDIPCLVILDLRLPDSHGLELCGWAREHARLSDIPIVALTGQDELSHKEKGFAAGVDQYLTKPIAMDELVMWVKALLRRAAMGKNNGTVLTLGVLKIDPAAQIVKYKGSVVPNLTRREFELFYALVKNSPRLLSRQEILVNIWRTVAVDNLVDTHMFNLRNKLPRQLSVNIQAVSGKGFRYLDKDWNAFGEAPWHSPMA